MNAPTEHTNLPEMCLIIHVFNSFFIMYRHIGYSSGLGFYSRACVSYQDRENAIVLRVPSWFFFTSGAFSVAILKLKNFPIRCLKNKYRTKEIVANVCFFFYIWLKKKRSSRGKIVFAVSEKIYVDVL